MDTQNIIAEFPIGEDDSLLCEKYFYEYSGLFKLMTQFTSDSPYKVDKIRYEELLEKYIEAYMIYNVFFNYLREKYVTEDAYKSLGSDYEYSVDFNSQYIYIRMKGSCGSCQR